MPPGPECPPTSAYPASHHPMARVWACVDLDAYEHNVRKIRAILKHGAELCAVVKADAYGHGAVPVARAALAAGAGRLGVASVPEGLELREAGLHPPILLLGPCVPEELQPGIEADLTFAVSSEDEVAALAERTRATHQGVRRGRRTKVHLLVDTGMGRGGFAPADLWPAAERVLAEKTLKLEGVFSHFSSAEEPDPAFTREQVALFRRLLRDLDERGVRFAVRHVANSAAAAFYPESQLDMVRIGALLHGSRAWDAARDGLALLPTLSLYTRIVHLGKRPKGWTVGYNRTHRCERESVLATLPVGYRDGYRRSLSGRGEVLIRGRRLPVLGTISMDYIVVDVTPLAQTPLGLPKAGDRVTLIGGGEDGGERISVEELAAASGTIPYVVTTQISARVQRLYRGRLAAGAAEAARLKELDKMELRRIAPSRTIPFPVPAASPAVSESSDPPPRLAAGA